MGAPYIYDISRLRVNLSEYIVVYVSFSDAAGVLSVSSFDVLSVIRVALLLIDVLLYCCR